MRNQLVIISMLLLSWRLGAQSILTEEILPEQDKKQYLFTPEIQGTYSVIVYGPDGEIKSSLVQKRELKSSEELALRFSTKWWTRGVYRLEIESSDGTLITREFRHGH